MKVNFFVADWKAGNLKADIIGRKKRLSHLLEQKKPNFLSRKNLLIDLTWSKFFVILHDIVIIFLSVIKLSF